MTPEVRVEMGERIFESETETLLETGLLDLVPLQRLVIDEASQINVVEYLVSPGTNSVSLLCRRSTPVAARFRLLPQAEEDLLLIDEGISALKVFLQDRLVRLRNALFQLPGEVVRLRLRGCGHLCSLQALTLIPY